MTDLTRGPALQAVASEMRAATDMLRTAVTPAGTVEDDATPRALLALTHAALAIASALGALAEHATAPRTLAERVQAKQGEAIL